jgi:hypothetical protein
MTLRAEQARPTIHWDIDQYHELQDSAWELDASAFAQDMHARRDPNVPNGAVSRGEAGALRNQAAHMLAQYWVMRAT